MSKWIVPPIVSQNLKKRGIVPIKTKTNNLGSLRGIVTGTFHKELSDNLCFRVFHVNYINFFFVSSGKDRNLNIVELLCASCNRWYHESCIGYQLGKLVPFMTNYLFICKNCSSTGLETFKKNQARKYIISGEAVDCMALTLQFKFP